MDCRFLTALRIPLIGKKLPIVSILLKPCLKRLSVIIIFYGINSVAVLLSRFDADIDCICISCTYCGIDIPLLKVLQSQWLIHFFI